MNDLREPQLHSGPLGTYTKAAVWPGAAYPATVENAAACVCGQVLVCMCPGTQQTTLSTVDLSATVDGAGLWPCLRLRVLPCIKQADCCVNL